MTWVNANPATVNVKNVMDQIETNAKIVIQMLISTQMVLRLVIAIHISTILLLSNRLRNALDVMIVAKLAMTVLQILVSVVSLKMQLQSMVCALVLMDTIWIKIFHVLIISSLPLLLRAVLQNVCRMKSYNF